jgi:hypothetical protein
MKPPQIGDFSLSNERMANIQALGPQMPSDDRLRRMMKPSDYRMKASTSAQRG